MILIILLLGLCFGSFVNVLIYRLPKGFSLMGRSFCPKCKKTISWYDNVPLLSYLLLKGRCRRCKKTISIIYPIIELSTALIFLVTFLASKGLAFGSYVTYMVYVYILIVLLIAVFVIDLKHYIIPDRFVVILCLLSIFFNLFFDFLNWKNGMLNFWSESSFVSGIIAAVLASGFFLLMILISKGKWMGLGDAKLSVFMGLFLGFPKIICALFLAFAMGAIIGVALICAKKKKIGSEIPFGPFLAIGTIVSMFFGNQVISWYLRIIS